MFKSFFNASIPIGLSLSAVVLCLVAPAPHNPPTTADYSKVFSSPRTMTIDPATQVVTLEAID